MGNENGHCPNGTVCRTFVENFVVHAVVHFIGKKWAEFDKVRDKVDDKVWKRALRQALANPLFCLLLMIAAFSARADSFTNNPVGATNSLSYFRRSFEETERRYKKSPQSIEAAWQFARACFDLADAADSNSKRAEFAEKGIDACRGALTRDPDSAAAHYYLGVNLGELAETRGLGAFKLIKEMEAEFMKTHDLDEHFDYAGPDRGLGLLYRDAPAVGSVGSRSKARHHLERALKLAPQYPENRLNLIEAYLKWGDRHDATRELKELEEALPAARAQFAGEAWASSWSDWDQRLNQVKKKIEQPPKALQAPSQRP
jgi:tetratricopeptide (TPR) repeat protein